MRSLIVWSLLLTGWVFCQSYVAAESQSVPLGLSIHQAEKAYAGFTLYPQGKRSVLLLNMQGESVHEWPVPAVRARLLPNCNLLVVHDAHVRDGKKKLNQTVREYDWNAAVVWEYSSALVIHHDVQRMADGNTIFLELERIPFFPEATPEEPEPRERRVRTDIIREIDAAGQTVWQWRAEEHLDLRRCQALNCRYPLESPHWIDKLRDWTHGNTVQILPENRWYREGDSRFRPGNIMFMPRNLWVAMIIDRESKEVVWEYGGDYRGGLRFPHESHMLAEGLPGAGNVLIFDNGRGDRGSFILEINPVTQELVWVYEDGPNFFSKGQGSVQRLPNGNTFISEDDRGRVFEVTPDQEIVWQYRGASYSRRAQRYSAGHCPRLPLLSQ